MRLAETGGPGGIPAEVMAALPISAEVVVGAVFSVFGSAVLERLGEKRGVVISAILFTAGFALRIVPNIWVLTVGNGIVGAGWGLLLLIINAMIAMNEHKKPCEVLKKLGYGLDDEFKVQSLNFSAYKVQENSTSHSAYRQDLINKVLLKDLSK